jgi:hypothetical protein
VSVGFGAKFCPIPTRGRQQLEIETENWKRISGVIRRVLRQEAANWS